ncbi:hypothetical protein [Desulforamulus hydrothermalis]|nr:hypothetical protein [Desulforamulus hydrothermalis]
MSFYIKNYACLGRRQSVDKHYRWFMIPFGSGLRTDSTMIRSGRP